MAESNEMSDAASKFKIYLLDVGPQKYGDAVLCQFGDFSILIDGAHPGNYRDYGDEHLSLQSQISKYLGTSSAHVDLLIVTHAHSDHIGCLPTLIQRGYLTTKFALVADPNLGWGRSHGDAVPAGDLQTPSDKIAAALREEVHSFNEDPQQLAHFISDAADLESSYSSMLGKLDHDCQLVVRYTGEASENLPQLINELANRGIKMTILGPSIDQLLICAENLQNRSGDDITILNSSLSDSQDVDLVSSYLQIVKQRDLLNSDGTVLTDNRTDSGGAFINLQSLVCAFEYQGKKLLFTGDMQLSKPEVSNPEIKTEVAKIVNNIANNGPYSFVKLPHHGSYNGFDNNILEKCGTLAYGMCCGSTTDRGHPSPDVLKLLKNQPHSEWARTDRNGVSIFTFTQASVPDLEVEYGGKNNTVVNGTDEEAETFEVTPPAAAVSAPLLSSSKPILAPTKPMQNVFIRQSQTGSKDIEVQAYVKVPDSVSRVDISFKFDQKESGSGEDVSFEDNGGPINIAGGRALPNLLFITNKTILSQNIGQNECANLLKSINAKKMQLIDDLPMPANNSLETVQVVQKALANDATIKGVVILGGYDVVSALRLDCLPPALRQKIGYTADDDNFIVWSDDLYGDLDGDKIPELPVSRIPDGKYAPLILNAVQANLINTGNSKAGLRNVARPFAQVVYNQIPGGSNANMLCSIPTVYNQNPAYSLDGEKIYLMLHGSPTDGSRFWGENNNHSAVPAVSIQNIPNPSAPVIFTGCCWGALIVDTIASEYFPNQPLVSRTHENSIALNFLLNGAVAFVGCTGEHYSPASAPTYFGGPMHTAFWKYYNGGMAPAPALLAAKKEYRQNMPHQQTDPEPMAIEFKILQQYTCLGLGW